MAGRDPGRNQPTAGQLHATPDRRGEYHEVHPQESGRPTTSKRQQDGGGRLWSTSPPFLHGGPKKKTTPTRQSSSALAQEETRHGPFPTLPRKCVFIPNNRPSIPWWDGSLAANRKWPSGYKKGPRTLRRASSS